MLLLANDICHGGVFSGASSHKNCIPSLAFIKGCHGHINFDDAFGSIL